jgi:hypothetical protein
MKRNATFLLFVPVAVFVLTIGNACAATYTPSDLTPTPEPQNPGEIAMTMVAQKVEAEATQMSINVQFTATAQVVWLTQNAQGTQNAISITEQARRDAIATDNRMRQDAAATQARIDAVSTAEQYQRNVIGTATAEMQSIYNSQTAQVMPAHATWTAQAIVVEQALATNQVEKSNLEIEQQRQKNTPEWFIPYSGVVLAAVVLSIWMLRRSRIFEVKNQQTGALESIIIDGVKSLRPSLQAGPLMIIEGKTGPTVPQVSQPEEQREVTRRAQGIEFMKAMADASAATPAGMGMYNDMFGGDGPTRFDILDAGEMPPSKVIDAETVSALDQDWKE